MSLHLACAALLPGLCAAEIAAPGDAVATIPPVGYVAEPGRHAWTGRLRAIRIPIGARQPSTPTGPELWEAGARLDAASPAKRHIVTAGPPIAGLATDSAPLHWLALPPELRASLVATLGGTARATRALAWLRGEPGDSGTNSGTNSGNASTHGASHRPMRPRETRLASPAGARVALVPPDRPELVWLGTNDGLLHAFDAATGEERFAYLSPAMLTAAASGAFAGSRLPAPPCPRPEVAATPGTGSPRFHLLCGNGAAGHASVSVFAIDAARTAHRADIANSANSANSPNVSSTADAANTRHAARESGIRLAGELSGSARLPLAPAGPVRGARIAGLDEGGAAWHIAVPTAAWGPAHDATAKGNAGSNPGGIPDSDTGGHGGAAAAAETSVVEAALVLLPMAASAFPPDPSFASIRLPLPAEGCGGTAAGRLRSVTLMSEALRGDFASAAYAVGDAGRLWRFDLRDLPARGDAPGRAMCLHQPDDANQGAGGAPESEPPALVSIPGGVVAIYGSGNAVIAIHDAFENSPPGATASRNAVPSCALRHLSATVGRDGVRLRSDAGSCAAASGPAGMATPGWRLELPRRGERLEQIHGIESSYVAFTTRTPEGLRHGYLLQALSGEAAPAHPAGNAADAFQTAATGHALGGPGAQALGLVHVAMDEAGYPRGSDIALSLHSVESGTTHATPPVRVARPGGRLGWRMLHAPAQVAGPGHADIP